MSTTFISTSLESLKDDLMEYINDENLDMLDEFTDEEIADCVLAIASHILLPAKVVAHRLISNSGIWNYQIKVNNTHKGFVSVSCEELDTTGVSNTQYFPFFKDEDEGYFAGLCSLASMINEAWYLSNN